MLKDLSHAQERRRLCGKEWVFLQDNAAIHNASTIKKYSLEQKISLLDHLQWSLDLNSIEKLWVLTVANVYKRGRKYSAISELKTQS